jgi:SAM-dependent methyltransferase
MTHSSIKSVRVPGSFRDPSGYVFRYGKKIFRTLDQGCFETLQELDQSKLLRELVDQQLLVGSQFVSDSRLKEELCLEHPGFEHFVEHEKIESISFPYEWSVNMLADAALTTIKVQKKLLSKGFSLKDGTAYNIQFHKGRPVFIDITSIEKPHRLDLWFAMGQFNQMFCFPLLLTKHRGWDIKSYFIGNPAGFSLGRMGEAFGRMKSFMPSAFLDIGLPNLLSRKSDGERDDGRELIERDSKNPKALLLNLNRIESKIRRLAKGYKHSSDWSDYTNFTHYDSEEKVLKKKLVKRLVAECSPGSVLDVGCNTGEFSFIAAESGARVTSIDSDHDAVDLLYQKSREGNLDITPLVADVSCPSPGLGYMNTEWPSFLERSEHDMVIALAVIHHLLVSANLSMEAIRDMFSSLSRSHLILEFVPPQDPMFQKIMRFRVNLFDHVNLEYCKKIFSEKYNLVTEQQITGSQRVLLLFEKKSWEESR